MNTNKRSMMGLALAVSLTLGSSAVIAANDVNPEKESNISVVFDNGIKHGKLETAILFNEHISAFDIDTDVNNDVATLSGTVKTEVEKEIAEQVALSIDGINKVKNNLKVDAKAVPESVEKAGSELMGNLSDVKITAMIESKLAINSHLSALDIDVDTDNQKVTLNGTVKTEQLKELAELIAQNTDGVKEVENKLSVSSSVALL